ncbi:hypothetical protein [uncultured Veillonella sp.]|uniref:DUF1659 domain-containing protein n=1 Tax=uncultured Veillonella sp. TaxID=159268 RepID=UPI0025FA915E|nr:hypothetical protein [uncultured Veillonella sp.]MDY3973733.1 hypothetical protein [Veillonella caviae]
MADVENTMVEAVKAQVRLTMEENKTKSITLNPVNPAVDPRDFTEIGKAVAGLCAYPYKEVVRVETTTLGPQA